MPQVTWPDSGALATVAGLIAAFAVSMFSFRIQRELQMKEQLEINWVPWADWLLLAAAWCSLLLVILPLVALPPISIAVRLLPPAACGAAAVLVVGYTLAILAHYRLLLGGGRRGPRVNPEPGERLVVIASIIAALIAFAWVAYLHVP